MINILTTLGISGIVVTGFVWFLKLLLDKYFALQTKKLEQEHQIKFSNLHEERAKIIAELYDKIVNVEDSLNSCTFSLFNKEKKNISLKETMNKFLEFANFFARKKIYFSEQQCKLILELLENQGEVWVDLTIDDNESEDAIKKFRKAKGKIDLNIKVIKEQIENEFRKLLGVI